MKRVQEIQKSERGVTMKVKGSSFGGTVQVVQVVKKEEQSKKGKCGSGVGGKKT